MTVNGNVKCHFSVRPLVKFTIFLNTHSTLKGTVAMDCSFEHLKQMLKMMNEIIFTILYPKILFNWTYAVR